MQISKRAPLNRASAAGFAPQVDGRRLRGARTKQRVIDALLELVREGNLNPRVGEIAERAGCVARSIFDHFVAIDKLHGAAAEYADAAFRFCHFFRSWRMTSVIPFTP